MKRWIVFILFSIQILTAQTKFDLQGHRGARGLAPENTLPAFLIAIKYQVTTLEMDVVITKDGKVLVSHDPWINKTFCIQPEGKKWGKVSRLKYNIFKMNYEEVKKYDCGSQFYSRFPEQKLQNVHKPLLSELIPEIQTYLKENNLPQVQYSIEIKSAKWADGIFHPIPKVFSELLINDLIKLGILDNCIIQSFDVRPLKYIHENYPEIKISYLVHNEKSFEKNLKLLEFTPNIYSPNYKLVDSVLIQQAHEKNIQVIPWTVDLETEMQKLIDLGIDGLITDYPNLGKIVIDKNFKPSAN
jgi:glycerophosphoryl diester phosphodiesterase